MADRRITAQPALSHHLDQARRYIGSTAFERRPIRIHACFQERARSYTRLELGKDDAGI